MGVFPETSKLGVGNMGLRDLFLLHDCITLINHSHSVIRNITYRFLSLTDDKLSSFIKS